MTKEFTETIERLRKSPPGSVQPVPEEFLESPVLPPVHDSGVRQQFATGSVRDTQEGKGRFDLIPFEALLRIARVFEAGAEKYGDRNWEKGQPISRFCSSAARHLYKYLAGWDDEDHLAMAGWNIMAALTMEDRPSLPNSVRDVTAKYNGSQEEKP